MNEIRSAVLILAMGLAIAFLCFSQPARADGNPPRFEIDPYWPKPFRDIN